MPEAIQKKESEMTQELVQKEEVKSINVMRPSVTLAEVQASRKEIHALIQQGLKDKVDYGIIPKTEKPTLYQAGAQQVCGWFDVYPTYDILSEDHDYGHEELITTKNGNSFTAQGLHTFRMACKLIHRPTKHVVGEGVGSCSSVENKYKSRPNDVENTVLKMAKKRAFVDATLTTFSLSDRFTQDLEDMGPIAPPQDERVKKEDRIELPKDAPLRYSDYKGSTNVWAYVGEHYDRGDLEKAGMKESKKEGQFFVKYNDDLVQFLLELWKDRSSLPKMDQSPEPLEDRDDV